MDDSDSAVGMGLWLVWVDLAGSNPVVSDVVDLAKVQGYAVFLFFRKQFAVRLDSAYTTVVQHQRSDLGWSGRYGLVGRSISAGDR